MKSSYSKIVTVHIFQIGCRGFGRYGFEKLVDKERFFPDNVVFEAVCEKDFEHSENAEKFAEATGTEVDFYDSVDKLYEQAQSVDGTVLIYDAGPVKRHANHIQRSLSNDFYHLAEKPPSISREEHIKERKLAAKHSVHFKVDFLERENPAFKKAKEILEDTEISSIEVFKQSSTGIQRMLQRVEKAHVNEGCTLDEMLHDIYIMDLANLQNLEVESVEDAIFMPKEIGSESFLRIDGGMSASVSKENSLAQVSAKIRSDRASIELNSSWIGLTKSAKLWSQKVEKRFDASLTRSEYREIDGESFLDQGTHFFVVEGNRNILCDLMNSKLYDLEHEKEIDVDVYPRDQLYRVLEKAVVDAAGGSVEEPEEEKLDSYMNMLFDIQEEVGEKEFDVFEELDSVSEKIRSMLVSDKTELDKDKLKGVAS